MSWEACKLLGLRLVVGLTGSRNNHSGGRLLVDIVGVGVGSSTAGEGGTRRQ